MGVTRVIVTIDRVAVKGRAANPRGIERGIRRELARILAAPALSAALATDSAKALVRLESGTAMRAASSADIGAQVGRTIARGLTAK
jgi:hypothetical protein